jgi:hypothetical protein
VDEKSRVRIGKRLEAPRPALVLGHDRSAQPAPVERGSHDAEREDPLERRYGLDAEETAEFPVR